MARTPKSDKARLTEIIKQMLGERVTIKLLEEIDPELLKELQAGKAVPTVADMLAKKVIRLALDPQKSNQWAVELIFDRLEGKAPKGTPMREDGRVIEERLDAITTEHLNSLAAQFARQTTVEFGSGSEIEDTTSGPASKLLDLQQDRTVSAEEVGCEPAVAAGIETESG